MDHKISIITVVYNAENLLEKTISSILTQKYNSFEYIIIDGGSSDGTLRIIDKYKSSISKIVSEKDNGIYDAMNKGLAIASGEYVWFINAGDQITSGDILAKIFQSPQEVDLYYGDTEIVDRVGKKVGLRRLRPPEQLTWKSFRMGMLVSHQAIIVRKSLVKKFNLKYKVSSDIDWTIDALKKSKTIKNTHQVLINYLQQGYSRKHIPRSLWERFKIMTKYYGLIQTSLYHLVITFRFLYFLIRNRRF